jgi:hypothetical protein
MILNYMGIYPGPSNRGIDKIREDSEFDSRQLDAAPQYMNSPNCRTNITTNTIKYNTPTLRNTKDPPNDQIIEYSTLSTWNRKMEKEYQIRKRAHQNDPEVSYINKQIRENEGITYKGVNTLEPKKDEKQITSVKIKKSTTSQSQRKIYQTNDIKKTNTKICIAQKFLESYLSEMEMRFEWCGAENQKNSKISKLIPLLLAIIQERVKSFYYYYLKTWNDRSFIILEFVFDMECYRKHANISHDILPCEMISSDLMFRGHSILSCEMIFSSILFCEMISRVVSGLMMFRVLRIISNFE